MSTSRHIPTLVHIPIPPHPAFLVSSHRSHWVFFPKSVARTLYRLLTCSDGKLDVPRDSVGCLDNIQHPKPNKYDIYEHRKFGTARPSAPADTPADAADPTVARAPSSTATATCDAPHGAAFLSARTISALLTAASSDHHSARTDPATTARCRGRA